MDKKNIFFKKNTPERIFYLFVFLFFPSFSYAANFNIVAGLNSPYFIQYSDKGVPSGVAVEIMAEALASEKISYSFDKYDWPWKRALDTFNEKKNSIGFLTKTPDREKDYRWVAPILSDNLYVFTFDKQKPIENLDELKALKKIGALAGSGSENTLISNGLTTQRVRCKDDRQCLELLAAGNLDAWVASKYKSNYRIKELNLQNKVHKGMALLNTDIWMISSLKTDDTDYTKLKNTISKFMLKKEYMDILKKYE